MSEAHRFLDALLSVMPSRRNSLERILIVGPGLDDPFLNLAGLFPSARLIVIEVDPDAAKWLRELVRDNATLIAVIAGDASDPKFLPLEAYNLVVMRHPDIARQQARWQSVASLCIERLAPGGIIVVSTYSLREMSFIDNVFRRQPVEVLPGSPYTTQPVPLRGDDRYIRVAQKRV